MLINDTDVSSVGCIQSKVRVNPHFGINLYESQDDVIMTNGRNSELHLFHSHWRIAANE